MLEALQIAESEYLNDPLSIEKIRIKLQDNGPILSSSFHQDHELTSGESTSICDVSIHLQHDASDSNVLAHYKDENNVLCDQPNLVQHELHNSPNIILPVPTNVQQPQQSIVNFDYSVEFTQPDVRYDIDIALNDRQKATKQLVLEEKETETLLQLVGTPESDEFLPNTLSYSNLNASSTTKYSLTDPLYIEGWPKFIWGRTYFPYLPQPKVIIDKLGDETTKNVVLYVVEQTFRMEDNLALQMSIWLSKTMNLPLIVAVIVSENMMNDIITYQFDTNDQNSSHTNILNQQVRHQNKVTPTGMFSLNKKSIATEAIERKSFMSVSKFLSLKKALYKQYGIPLFGFVMKTSTLYNNNASSSNSNNHDYDSLKISKCLQLLKLNSKLSITCLFTDSINNPLQRKTIQSLCHFHPDIPIIAIDNDRICILPSTIPTQTPSNRNPNIFEGIMTHAEEKSFKTSYSIQKDIYSSLDIDALFGNLTSAKFTSLDIDAISDCIPVYPTTTSSNNNGIFNIDNNSDIYLIPWDRLYGIVTQYASKIMSTMTPFFHTLPPTQQPQPQSLISIAIGNQKYNHPTERPPDTTVTKTALATATKTPKISLPLHQPSITATPCTAAVSRRITFGGDTIVQKPLESYNHSSSTPININANININTNTNQYNSSDASTGTSTATNTILNFAHPSYLHTITLLQNDSLDEFLNQIILLLKCVTNDNTHQSSSSSLSSSSSTLLDITNTNNTNSNKHLLRNYISEIIYMFSVLYECIDQCIVSPRQIIHFMQSHSLCDEHDTVADNNNNNNDQYTANNKNTDIDNNTTNVMTGYPCVTPRSANLYSSSTDMETNNHNVDNKQEYSKTISVYSPIFNIQSIFHMLYSIDFCRHITSCLPVQIVNHSSFNTYNSRDFKHKSSYEPYLSFLDLIPTNTIEKLHLLSYILKVLKNAQMMNSLPLIPHNTNNATNSQTHTVTSNSSSTITTTNNVSIYGNTNHSNTAIVSNISSNLSNTIKSTNSTSTTSYPINTNSSYPINTNNNIITSNKSQYDHHNNYNIYPHHIRSAQTSDLLFNSLQNMMIQTGHICLNNIFMDYYLCYLLIHLPTPELAIKCALIEIATLTKTDPEKSTYLPHMLHRLQEVTLPLLLNLLNDNFESLSLLDTSSSHNNSGGGGVSNSSSSNSNSNSKGSSNNNISHSKTNINTSSNLKAKSSINNQFVNTTTTNTITNNNSNNTNNTNTHNIEKRIIKLVYERVVETVGDILVNKIIFEWSPSTADRRIYNISRT